MTRRTEALMTLIGKLAPLAPGPQRDAVLAALRAACAEAAAERDALAWRLGAQWDWLWQTPEDHPLFESREGIWRSVLRDYELLCDAIALARDTIARPTREVAMPCPF